MITNGTSAKQAHTAEYISGKNGGGHNAKRENPTYGFFGFND